jgi:hypothetical protein
LIAIVVVVDDDDVVSSSFREVNNNRRSGVGMDGNTIDDDGSLDVDVLYLLPPATGGGG